MPSILRDDAPVWRAHWWVFGLWLSAVATMVICVVVAVTSGLGSRAVYGWLVLSVSLELLHDWFVRRYSKRDLPPSETHSPA